MSTCGLKARGLFRKTNIVLTDKETTFLLTVLMVDNQTTRAAG